MSAFVIYKIALVVFIILLKSFSINEILSSYILFSEHGKEILSLQDEVKRKE